MINYVVDWLINKSLTATNEIIEGTSVLMEIKRRIPTGKELFKFRQK